jgi:hypothetical protein
LVLPMSIAITRYQFFRDSFFSFFIDPSINFCELFSIFRIWMLL